MVQSFGSYKAYAATSEAARKAQAEDMPTSLSHPPQGTHQERVNVEMFKAIEVLGRKLERAESERDRLQRRLALIESAATIDETTGKLYLPVVMDSPAAPPAAINPQTPKWMMGATLASSAIALLALSVVLMRPVASPLTAEQMAVLNSLTGTRFSEINANPWNKVPATGAQAESAPVDTAAAMPPPQPQAAPSQDMASPSAPAQTAPADSDIAQWLSQDPQTDPAANGEETLDAMMAGAAAETQPQDDDLSSASLTAAEDAQDSAAASETDAVPAGRLTQAQPPVERIPVEEIAQAETETETATKAPPETASAAPKAAAVDAPSHALVAGTEIGRDKNLPERLRAVETRAMEGIPEAQHDLATLYASGKMVGQDYKRAAYWFSKAADGGVANAHYNLGVMFQQGLGIRKDAAKAIGWYEKAAELGHPEAMYNLGIAYIEGVGAERNVERGISFFKRAADAGVAQAAFNLGVLYESGFAGPIDMRSAQDWYQVAANQGHGEAVEALARLGGGETTVAEQQALTLADMVEPAGGEESGQGDASPADETRAYKNDLVGKIQSALIKKGYLPGKPTGVMDARTEDAIRAWQKVENEKVTGVPSVDLLGKLTNPGPNR